MRSFKPESTAAIFASTLAALLTALPTTADALDNHGHSDSVGMRISDGGIYHLSDENVDYEATMSELEVVEAEDFSLSHACHDKQCHKCNDKQSCHGVSTDPGRPKKPKRTLPGDVDRGDCPPKRYCMDDCERAGYPNCVAPWAKCSVDGKYSAWFVGGGAAFWKGRGRCSHEGTWGLDYSGLFGRANVWLNYTRGRYQGGEGAYETVGGPEPFKFLHHE